MEHKCKHAFDVNDTSLVMMRKRVMTYPPVQEGYCKCCGKTFKFTLDEFGKFTKELPSETLKQ